MTTPFETQATKAIEHLQHELQGIRTGRANPALVEDILVEAYGTPTPLQQLAAINAPEPRLIVIQPWDPGVLRDIEKALSQSSLGINPIVDGKLIRLPFPTMTEERRKEMQKIVHEKAEEAKVHIRTIREELIKHLRNDERDGKLSEDALALELKKLQLAVDESLKKIEQAIELKIEELTTI